MQAFHQGDGLVLAEQLRQRRQRQKSGSRRRRVTHHDLAFKRRTGQITPAARGLDAQAFELFWTVSDAEHPRIQPDRPIVATFGLRLRPRLKIVERPGTIAERHAEFSGLKMRIPRPAEPDVGARIVALGQ